MSVYYIQRKVILCSKTVLDNELVVANSFNTIEKLMVEFIKINFHLK